MNTRDILQALPQLTPHDRLTIANAALRLIQQDQASLTLDQHHQQLTIAAMAAIEDYTPGSELIAFTELDGEGFYDDEVGTVDPVAYHA